jgi:hypothetical protein
LKIFIISSRLDAIVDICWLCIMCCFDTKLLLSCSRMRFQFQKQRLFVLSIVGFWMFVANKSRMHMRWFGGSLYFRFRYYNHCLPFATHYVLSVLCLMVFFDMILQSWVCWCLLRINAHKSCLKNWKNLKLLNLGIPPIIRF